MLSAESIFWVCSIVLFAVRKGCARASFKKVSDLCLLYEIYHRVDYPMNKYTRQIVAARNNRASAALGEIALVIPRS